MSEYALPSVDATWIDRLKALCLWLRLVAETIAPLLALYLCLPLLNDWVGPAEGRLVRSVCLIVPVPVMLLYPLSIMRMERRVVKMTRRGDYERAIRITKTRRFSRYHCRSTRGWVLLSAGRYDEAQADLKKAAFDQKGDPRLTNLYLYFYALTLIHLDRYEEAQQLLEAAIRVHQETTAFHFLLADCLLLQNKEPGRARELIKFVVDEVGKLGGRVETRGFMAQSLALDAWALALEKRGEEAEKRLEDAFTEYASLSKQEQAGLVIQKGIVVEALGRHNMARKTFETALELFPFGIVAAYARKRLELLGERAAGR